MRAVSLRRPVRDNGIIPQSVQANRWPGSVCFNAARNRSATVSAAFDRFAADIDNAQKHVLAAEGGYHRNINAARCGFNRNLIDRRICQQGQRGFVMAPIGVSRLPAFHVRCAVTVTDMHGLGDGHPVCGAFQCRHTPVLHFVDVDVEGMVRRTGSPRRRLPAEPVPPGSAVRRTGTQVVPRAATDRVDQAVDDGHRAGQCDLDGPGGHRSGGAHRIGEDRAAPFRFANHPGGRNFLVIAPAALRALAEVDRVDAIEPLVETQM